MASCFCFLKVYSLPLCLHVLTRGFAMRALVFTHCPCQRAHSPLARPRRCPLSKNSFSASRVRLPSDRASVPPPSRPVRSKRTSQRPASSCLSNHSARLDTPPSVCPQMGLLFHAFSSSVVSNKWIIMADEYWNDHEVGLRKSEETKKADSNLRNFWNMEFMLSNSLLTFI